MCVCVFACVCVCVLDHSVFVCACLCLCLCLCLCVCVCVVGALVVQLVESWVYNSEDTGSHPRAGGKKHHKYSSPPAHPSVKWVPGLVLGSKVHWLCL